MFASLMADLIGIDAAPLDCVALAARHGFAGIDLRLNRNPERIEAVGTDRLRDAITAAHLRPGYCSVLPHNLSIDDDAWRQAMADLPKLARWAADIGYTRTSTVILPFHDTLPFDAAFAQHVERIRAAMSILTDHNLALGLEYVSPLTRRAGKPHPFIHDLQGALQLFDACNLPGVGLMLDTFHWHCAGETTADLAQLRPDQVIVVHVNDAPRKPIIEQAVTDRELPGDTGVIDVQAFLTTLNTLGYTGPVTAEPTNARWKTLPPNDVAARTAASIHRCLNAPC